MPSKAMRRNARVALLLLRSSAASVTCSLSFWNAPWQRLIRRTTNLFFAERRKEVAPARGAPGPGGA